MKTLEQLFVCNKCSKEKHISCMIRALEPQLLPKHCPYGFADAGWISLLTRLSYGWEYVDVRNQEDKDA